jgi:hypothetical protein
MYIAEIARAMLNEKNLPNYFWVEVVATVVYIMNRTPTSIVHGMTLEEKFISKKPNVSHLIMFGCITYVHVPNEKRSKLDPKAKKCIFIRYSLEQKGYRCFNLSTRKLQGSRDVMFDEMVNWYLPLKISEDGEARNGDVSSNLEQESQLINGPQESSISGSNSTPWKGKLRYSNIVDGSSQTSSKNPHVDDESNDSKNSVGEESRIPLVTTPGVWMARKSLKTPNNNNGVQRRSSKTSEIAAAAKQSEREDLSTARAKAPRKRGTQRKDSISSVKTPSLHTLIAQPGSWSGAAPPDGEASQGPSLVDYNLKIKADFPKELVLTMQENAAKKARRIVIGRTLGGRATFKTLLDCLKLHLPAPLVSTTLLTKGYFEIMFEDEEGAKATRRLTVVEWSDLRLSFSRYIPNFDISSQGAEAQLTHAIKV